MTETTGNYMDDRGRCIHYRRWFTGADPGAARAGLVVVHGAAEHSGRYAHLGERYAERGYAVWALDLPGLGRSEGTRGHIDNFSEYLLDVGRLANLARKALPGRKVFLLGHSKGGLIALAYAERYGTAINGVAVSGPLLGLRMRVPPLKAKMARLLVNILPGLACATRSTRPRWPVTRRSDGSILRIPCSAPGLRCGTTPNCAQGDGGDRGRGFRACRTASPATPGGG